MRDAKARAAGGDEPREGGIRSWPQRVRDFYSETRLEMKRVTWPERKQVQATTVVVIVTVFFFGFYLFVMDQVFGRLINLLFRR